MKLIVDLPEDIYKEYMSIELAKMSFRQLWTICTAIKKGTPLPEHHGDLIDKNDLLKWSYKIDSKYYKYDEVVDVDDINNNVPTIIEGSDNNV